MVAKFLTQRNWTNNLSKELAFVCLCVVVFVPTYHGTMIAKHRVTHWKDTHWVSELILVWSKKAFHCSRTWCHVVSSLPGTTGNNTGNWQSLQDKTSFRSSLTIWMKILRWMSTQCLSPTLGQCVHHWENASCIIHVGNVSHIIIVRDYNCQLLFLKNHKHEPCLGSKGLLNWSALLISSLAN